MTTYINGGKLCHSDLYFSVLIPRVTFTRHAKTIIQKYRLLSSKILAVAASGLHIQIETYKGKNQHVHRMMSLLDEYLKDDLIGAYIHGSLGDYEEITYSDFDALVILKNEVFESSKRLARTAHRLYQAQKIMLGFDPLQHHGWFVLTEADLNFYCNSYFPFELFKHAKSLFNNKGLDLKITLRNSGSETCEIFNKMADSIIRKIGNQRYPTNLYQLKSLLSEFMLMPALYIQTKDGRGIYKKKSFELARIDFDASDWEIMDEVSKIRSSWNYEIYPIKKWLMSHPYILSRYFAKNFAPAIPKEICRILTSKFYTRMAKLVSLMKEKLN